MGAAVAAVATSTVQCHKSLAFVLGQAPVSAAALRRRPTAAAAAPAGRAVDAPPATSSQHEAIASTASTAAWCSRIPNNNRCSTAEPAVPSYCNDAVNPWRRSPALRNRVFVRSGLHAPIPHPTSSRHLTDPSSGWLEVRQQALRSSAACI